jgi:hypothetical protein
LNLVLVSCHEAHGSKKQPTEGIEPNFSASSVVLSAECQCAPSKLLDQIFIAVLVLLSWLGGVIAPDDAISIRTPKAELRAQSETALTLKPAS